ncbi:MAG: protein kinase [Myxococcales bacterium]|nr:protein kinase [Myxococcales bacterium]
MAVFICQGCGAEHSSWEGKCPACGTSETIRLAPSTDRMIDRVVKGKFKIIRKLGQGGMGAVYLAEQLGIGHRVALKFLKAEFSTDAEIARRFLNEAKSYARVAHPNAVALHDFGQDDEGNLFIAMEYCEGVDLKKVISEQGRLPMIEAIEVVLQVAEVLANAHDKGVIHRDLKPENIMIRRGIRGVHAKVLDFGIARLMDAGTKLTVAGAIAGTPRYMSPEQVEGREVDLRADVYSLGIVLFEALTGSQPFDGATVAEILRKQVVEPMPHLKERAADLDYPDLDAVIQKACVKKREQRWPDMLTLANALSQAIPTQAHLGLTPLQRTGVSSVGKVTPAPGTATQAGVTPGGPTGVALEGATDVGSDERTLLRTEAGRVAVGAKELDHARPGDAPLPPVAPRSKAPLIALFAVVVVAAGGAFVAFGRNHDAVAPPPKVAPETPQKPPEQPANPQKTPDTPVDSTVLAVQKAMHEQTARESLGRGKTEFELANLDEAETRLKDVAEDTPSWAEARPLLEQIADIRARLAQAKKLRSSGQCSAALPLYQAVLKVNPRVAEANEGVSFCKASTINTTLE